MTLVLTALSLTMFLAALDQTIVTTALPTITADLKGNSSDYAWVGTAYMLVASSLTPLVSAVRAKRRVEGIGESFADCFVRMVEFVVCSGGGCRIS